MSRDVVHWVVPPEWKGERCFILCGGPSLKDQRHFVPYLNGRVIAVKQSVLLRPTADVMFIAGKDDREICAPYFPLFRGEHLIARSAYPDLPDSVKYLQRTKVVDRLCEQPTHLAGLDAGTSAINLAYHFGAIEIVLLGYDMTGGRWFNGELPHPRPFPPQEHFDRHLKAAAGIAADLAAKKIRVVNVSPISKATCFERGALVEWL